MNMNPFVLRRENTLEKSAIIQDFETDNLREIYQLEKSLFELRNEIVNKINEILKSENTPILLDSIRYLRKNNISRFANNIKELLTIVPEDIRDSILELNELYNIHKELLVNAEILYEKNLTEVRKRYISILQENPFVSDGLLMINPQVYSKLTSYLNTPIDKHKSKHRKLEGTLYNFINRSALKTSPFSDITNVGRVELTSKSPSTRHYIKIVSLNFTFIYQLTFHYLINSDLFLKNVKYTLPPFSISIENGQYYIEFLSKKEHSERTKVFLSEERLGKLKIPSNLADLFNKKEMENYISFDEIHNTLGIDIEKNKIYRIIRNYLKVGLLIPTIGFNEKNCDVLLEDIKKKVENLLSQKSYLELNGYLNEVYELSKQISSATKIKEKHQQFNKLNTILQEINDETGINFASNQVFYEDGYYQEVEYLDRIAINEFLEPLKQIQTFSLIFDTSIRLRYEFAARLKKINDDDYLEMDSDFFSVLFELSKDMGKYWENPVYIASDHFQSEELKELDHLKHNFIEKINELCKNSKSDSLDIKKLIDTFIKRIPDEVKNLKGISTSVFAQINQDNLIINSLYEGQERYLARFMNNFNDYLNSNENYKKFIEDFYDVNNFYELTDSYGFNGNVKEQRLSRECYTLGVGTRRFSKEKNEILHKVEDFKVNANDKLFKFIDLNGNEAKICFRGSLTPTYMPGYIAILLQSFTSGAMYYKLSEMVNETFIPRITYDNIILNRKRVRLTVIQEELRKNDNESEFQYYKRINTTFLKLELDKQFFVVIDRSTQMDNERLYKFKPLFIDIENPLSVRVLRKEVIDRFEESLYKLFFMEEYLNNTGPYAKEFNFEIY